uniref:Gag-Pol polyprotein n=1 Tax=Tanacetum cinerariifolium TaxID=118510 RepID=A0A6L2KDA9_TANCI|nr:Gag-Pol polyprotein [Tanacetum cinerariifolium]GEX06143.1 Gag-Pol polyprotein [Tanacetum cinerariifolium]
MKIEELLNVTFDETPPPYKTSPLVNDDLDEDKAIRVTKKKNLKNDIEDKTLEIDEVVNIKESRNHPLENVKGNLNQRTLSSQAQNQRNFFCFISTIEPKNVNEALKDETNGTWVLVGEMDGGRGERVDSGGVVRSGGELVPGVSEGLAVKVLVACEFEKLTRIAPEGYITHCMQSPCP